MSMARKVFENGFFKDGRAADFLNIEAGEGKSQEVYVYMLESLGGDRPSNLDNPAAAATTDAKRIFFILQLLSFVHSPTTAV